MIKKLISLVCCLLPMGAGAVVVNPEIGNAFVSTESDAWKNAIEDNQTIEITTSEDFPAINGIVAANGFSIANNMYYGMPYQGSLNGDLYILSSVGNTFTIESQGDVSIGAMLQVLDSKSLAFKSNDSNSVSFDLIVGNGGVSIGAGASLAMQNIDAFTVGGAIEASGNLSVNANSVNVSGGIDINSGNALIAATGDVAFAGLTATGSGTTNISAGTDGDIVSDGIIQNNAGDMIITAGGKISVDGALENNVAAKMTVGGGDLSIATTMINANKNGDVLLEVDSWTVAGGTPSTYSVVNKGNFVANVSGQTSLANGINLSEMAVDSMFSLKTGTLVGSNLSQLFSNYLNDFELVVNAGDVNAGNLQNGVNSGGESNANANMSLMALNVVLDSITNSGNNLSVVAGGENAETDDGNVTIGGVIVGNAGSDTIVSAQGTLTATGGVTNQAKMVLNGNNVSLFDVVNVGEQANLTISSPTDPSGKVAISGALTNTGGQTIVWGKDVSIGGAVVNNSGVTTIRGSDTNGGAVQIGAINALGGVINLNALAGAASVVNGITVTEGALNLGDNLRNLSVDGSVQVDGDILASAGSTDVAGTMNIATKGNPFVLTADAVTVGGDIDITATDAVRNIVFDAISTQVAGDVSVANMGLLTIGQDAGNGVLNVAGDLSVKNGGVFKSYASEVNVTNVFSNALIELHGANLTATDGDVDIDGDLYFDPSNDPVSIASGLVVRDTSTLNMNADGIAIGAISVGSVNTLNMNATDAVVVDGTIVNNGIVKIEAVGTVSVSGAITNKDDITVSGDVLNFANVTNASKFSATSDDSILFKDIVNNGDSFDVIAGNSITAGDVTQSGGEINLDAFVISANSIELNGAAVADLTASTINVDENISVTGDFSQWGDSGMLNHSASVVSVNNLVVGGDFFVDGANTLYNIGTALRVGGGMDVAVGAEATVNAGGTITMSGLTNSGRLALFADNGISLGNLINNSDVLTLDVRSGGISLDGLTMNGGNVVFGGQQLDVITAFNTEGILYQGNSTSLDNKDINISSGNYVINASNISVAGIEQKGKLVINSSDIDVGGDINAVDLRFVAAPTDNWMNVNVDGNVSGNVDFIGLEKMTVSGNYVFNAGSNINAVVLPYAAGSTIDSTDVNYWSTVALGKDGIVHFENAADGSAMINIGGSFTAGQSVLDLSADDATAALAGGQIGLSLRDIVEQGTAIWFIHADGGVLDASSLGKVRNLEIKYCNADGSLCYDYMDSLDANNGTGSDASAYVAARDNDMYIVFDPRFGGPIEVFGLQPIVADYQLNTRGEIVAAGALDNMIAGRLKDKKFFNRTPIEVIPLIFRGTNMQEMANELYNRMEYYQETSRDAGIFANFARLFQPREMEQIAGSIALNEHTAFRSFEDRMFDEFIWNRNRNLKKAWLDVDYGMLYQNIQDGKHTDGNRFSISGGFDWQESNTLQLGLTGRIARTTSKSSDKMDLGYIPGESINGRIDVDVADTNIAFGGYLMKTVSEKVRLYGNAFVDMHVLDVNRTQNYVGAIDGDGAAFGLISEWGIMHDILNQYVVGNLYARAGYNFGFDVKEKVGGHDYMRMKSDGYLMLTPGYSVTAQKRIYPSAWFQIRPYASIGFEYDLLGAPNNAEYKFAPADVYTKYNVEINPLWANIGGGLELLSANGLQFGIDYRYQYNNDIQLHNIRISGSYRF